MSNNPKATTTSLPPSPGGAPRTSPPPPPSKKPSRQKQLKEKKREDRVFEVFRRLCTFRLPHLSYSDSFVMLQALDCKSMDDVWKYAVAGYNVPHFTQLIQKLVSGGLYSGHSGFDPLASEHPSRPSRVKKGLTSTNTFEKIYKCLHDGT